MNLSLFRNLMRADRPAVTRPPRWKRAPHRRPGRGIEFMENRLLLSATTATTQSNAAGASNTEGGYVEVSGPQATSDKIHWRTFSYTLSSGITRNSLLVYPTLGALGTSAPYTGAPNQLVNQPAEPASGASPEGGFVAMSFSRSEPARHEIFEPPSEQVLVHQTRESVAPDMAAPDARAASARLEASRGQSQAFEVASHDAPLSAEEVPAVRSSRQVAKTVDAPDRAVRLVHHVQSAPQALLAQGPIEAVQAARPVRSAPVAATEPIPVVDDPDLPNWDAPEQVELADIAWQQMGEADESRAAPVANVPSSDSGSDDLRPAALAGAVDFALDDEVAAVARWERSSMAQELSLVLLMCHLQALRRSQAEKPPAAPVRPFARHWAHHSP